MSGEVTVRPKAEAAQQKTVAAGFVAAKDSIPEITSDGLRGDHVTELRARRTRIQSGFQGAADLASKGATAATDIGQGDEQSGEKIRSC